MKNLTLSKRFSSQHDNGERNVCWRVGKPKESGMYILTIEGSDQSRIGLYDATEDYCNIGEIIAYMKLPSPYKPD